MTQPHLLVLDSEVRDWVFIPLTVFIVLMKLVMQYVHVVSYMGADWGCGGGGGGPCCGAVCFADAASLLAHSLHLLLADPPHPSTPHTNHLHRPCQQHHRPTKSSQRSGRCRQQRAAAGGARSAASCLRAPSPCASSSSWTRCAVGRCLCASAGLRASA